MEQNKRQPLSEIMLEEGITAQEFVDRFWGEPENRQWATDAVYKTISLGFTPPNQMVIEMVGRGEEGRIRRYRND